MVELRAESWAERALVPAFVFFFQLLYPFARVNDPRSRTAAAAGGTMLVRRTRARPHRRHRQPARRPDRRRDPRRAHQAGRPHLSRPQPPRPQPPPLSRAPPTSGAWSPAPPTSSSASRRCCCSAPWPGWPWSGSRRRCSRSSAAGRRASWARSPGPARRSPSCRRSAASANPRSGPSPCRRSPASTWPPRSAPPSTTIAAAASSGSAAPIGTPAA